MVCDIIMSLWKIDGIGNGDLLLTQNEQYYLIIQEIIQIPINRFNNLIFCLLQSYNRKKVDEGDYI